MVGGGADAAKVGPAGNSAFEELERGDSGSLAADAGESNVSIKSGYERGAPNGLKADGAGDLASDSGDKVPDGGLWAWMVVLACGLCNFICFGVQQSFGIFIG